MKRTLTKFLFLLTLTTSCYAAEFVIDQQGKEFFYNGEKITPDLVIDAKVGDTVRFVNSDSVVHNVYSLSDAMFFDSGAQRPKGDGGEDMSITFEAAGEVEIACAIHPNMVVNFNVK